MIFDQYFSEKWCFWREIEHDKRPVYIFALVRLIPNRLMLAVFNIYLLGIKLTKCKYIDKSFKTSIKRIGGGGVELISLISNN